MLQLSKTMLDRAVMSLRTGAPVASIQAAIINPNNLKIEGFYCQDSIDKKKRLILLSQDIRDILPQGYVINDHDVLSEPEELVRLKPVLDLNFEVQGKLVVTVDKQRVGKVNDYAVDTQSMYIQKLYVSQSLFKNFAGGSLSIDRGQINEVTPKRIIVNELLSKAPATAPAPLA